MIHKFNIEEFANINLLARDTLINLIAQLELKGTSSQFKKSIIRQIEAELERLRKYSASFIDSNVPNIYLSTSKSIYEKLKVPLAVQASLSILNKQVINSIVNNAKELLNNSISNVGRNINNKLEQARIDTILSLNNNNFKQNIVNSNLLGVPTANGNLLPFNFYNNLVAKSTITETGNRATLNQAKNLNLDLIKVTSHSGSCEKCKMYEGRVFSISGTDPNYPPFNMAYRGKYLNLHPQCKHIITIFVEDLASDEELEAARKASNRPFVLTDKQKQEIEMYNKVQKDKVRLNNDRKQWERYRLSGIDGVPKTLSGFRRSKASDSDKWQQLQSDYRELNKK